MKAKIYMYQGKAYNIHQLAEETGISEGILSSRISDYVPADTVIPQIQKEQQQKEALKNMVGKPLVIVFRRALSSVFPDKQPKLNTQYVAMPQRKIPKVLNCRMFYIVTLDDGSPLIVYPEEFEIIGEADLNETYRKDAPNVV